MFSNIVLYLIKKQMSKNQAKKTASFLWEFEEKDPKNKDTWYTSPRAEMKMKELAGTGMVEVYNHQFLWENRQSEKIYKAFIDIWGTKDLWVEAKEGDKIILIRHALAPGGGDPPGFKIDDCKTQRNLDKVGIEQSKAIGKLFKKNKIPVDKVLSSQWCRCKDTAKYAFKNYFEFPALNSTFQSSFAKNEPKQLKQLQTFVNNWDGDDKLPSDSRHFGHLAYEVKNIYQHEI